MSKPNATYRLHNDWGCGYSGEFIFDNPEFTQLRFKAVVEPISRASGDGETLSEGSIRVTYELEARRPRRLRPHRNGRQPLHTGAAR